MEAGGEFQGHLGPKIGYIETEGVKKTTLDHRLSSCILPGDLGTNSHEEPRFLDGEVEFEGVS